MTPVAGEGPLFVTVSVKMTLSPSRTTGALTVLTSDRSALISSPMSLPVPLVLVPVRSVMPVIAGGAAVPDSCEPTVAAPSLRSTAAALAIAYVPGRRPVKE